MKIKFSCLEPGDKVWVVYNKHYLERNGYFAFDNVERVLECATVLKNELEKREIYSSDYYDDYSYTVEEMNLKINTRFGEYKRRYSDFEDNKGQMTVTPDIYDNYPYLEVFSIKEAAIKYIELINMRDINRLKEEIKNREYQIQLCEQSIIDAKKLE